MKHSLIAVFLFGILLITTGIIIQTRANVTNMDMREMGLGVWNGLYLIGDLVLVFAGVNLYHRTK